MDKTSKKILKIFSKHQTLSLFELSDICHNSPAALAEPMLELIDKKYIEKMIDLNDLKNESFSPDAKYYITQEGKSYLDELKSNTLKTQFEIAIQILTTIIAIAAFIKSFFFNP